MRDVFDKCPAFKDDKIAILNDNSAYGKGLADETAKALHAAGGQEVLAAAYTPGEKDYSSLVSRLKQAGVTVIYVGGYHTEAGLIIRQAKEQGMKATMVGGDALVTNEFWQIAGESGSGTLMTFPPDPRLMKTAADVVKEFDGPNTFHFLDPPYPGHNVQVGEDRFDEVPINRVFRCAGRDCDEHRKSF